MVVGGLISAAAQALSYPPAGEFDFGNVMGAWTPTTTVDGDNYDCAFDELPEEWQQGVSSAGFSQFIGTGGPFAQISFSVPFYYEYFSGSTEAKSYVTFGTTADLNFSSPAGGTIRFDSVSETATGGAPKIGDSFPFTVKSTSVEGNFTFEYLIQFPNCALTIQGRYQ